MEKWADYCISKISFSENGKTITEIFIHEDYGETISSGEIRDRNWLIQKANIGKTFCCITKKVDGKWWKVCDFRHENGAFNWAGNLPKVLPKRKTFVSYYHNDDQNKREDFENLFEDLIVSKSVNDGDIDSTNSASYIKKLIQEGYLSDTTILVVLVGPKTKCRKHIDWEISGALNLKVGEKYAGLLALKLPTHPDYGTGNHTYSQLPKRLSENLKSGYARIADWTEDRAVLQGLIEDVFKLRDCDNLIINHGIPQMENNICS